MRKLASLAVGVVVLAVHLAGIPSQGLTDDDDFYAPAGIRYAEWLGDVFTQPSLAFSKSGVDAAFKLNHEHPPLAKFVFGVAHAIFHAVGFGDLDAARVGCALFAALLAAILTALLWAPLGRATALAAPALLLSLPRFFFHSEVATLDVPVSCAVLAITAAYFAAETSRDRRLSVVAGVVFGLGLLVKLNAPFAVIPCALWSLLASWRGFGVDKASLRVPRIPPALLWMIILGPILFVALWPWLWFDTTERIGAYIAFHLNHYPIYLFYDGEIWEKPFAPWHAVPVLGFGVLPATVLALGVLGSLRALRAIGRLARFADADGLVPDVTAGDKLRALLFLQAAFSMAVVANPGTPRYGGEKLFMPFFPLFCALAADGASLVVDAVVALWRGGNLRGEARGPRAFARRAASVNQIAASGGSGAGEGATEPGAGEHASPTTTTNPLSTLRTIATVVVVALACAPGVLGTAHFAGGYALSYYGESVGGLRGAVARGFERTYYDVADKPLAKWLDQQGARVHFEPNHKEYARTYRWLKRDGVISNVTLDDKRGSIEVLTHERRWSTYPALKAALENDPALFEKSIDGVPLYTVYRLR